MATLQWEYTDVLKLPVKRKRSVLLFQPVKFDGNREPSVYLALNSRVGCIGQMIDGKNEQAGSLPCLKYIWGFPFPARTFWLGLQLLSQLIPRLDLPGNGTPNCVGPQTAMGDCPPRLQNDSDSSKMKGLEWNCASCCLHSHLLFKKKKRQKALITEMHYTGR